LLPLTAVAILTGCGGGQNPPTTGGPENVIVCIPDGCGVGHMTIARWFKGAPLAQDSMEVSLMHTHCANSMITGSAAAATAFSSGHKTWEDRTEAQCLGLRPAADLITASGELPEQERYHPVASVLEAAKLAGKATGLVATSRISHATPAAYTSHWHDRANDNVIVKQQVYQNIDVVLGGGKRHLYDTATVVPPFGRTGKRGDGTDLAAVLVSRGYTVVSTRGELMNTTGVDKLWGLFSYSHLAHTTDRNRFGPEEPTLSEMTAKAIEILSRRDRGFFLMIEGSQVDWSSHDNDPYGVVTEYLEFERAVERALAFAAGPGKGNTLVLVFSDHDNGGMALGRRGLKYKRFVPADMNAVLTKPSLTAAGVHRILVDSIDRFDPSPEAITRIVETHYGIDDLKAEELALLVEEFADTLEYDLNGDTLFDSTGAPVYDARNINLARLLGPMLSVRAGIGWTTYGHTGTDVPLFSYGLSEVPQTVDNTAVARLCADYPGVDLERTTRRLFTDVEELFGAHAVTIDSTGAAAGRGLCRLRLKGEEVVLPFHTDLLIHRGDTLRQEGITVYSVKRHRVYVPRQTKTRIETIVSGRHGERVEL
jgi:alkaline phosphatase